MKKTFSVSGILILWLILAAPLYAHVVVRPNHAGVGSFQTFTIGVPVEKDVATIGMRLLIPDGLQYVSPNVKPGWRIEIKRAGEGEEAKVTELAWTGGTIPAGFRDEFLFSARVPSEETVLSWKAYQSYADGSVVSWDLGPDREQPQDANGSPDFSHAGPASMTEVVNDLKKPAEGGFLSSPGAIALVVSLVAFTLAVIAVVLQAARTRKQPAN